MKIVTLIENIVYKNGLKAEHGLSFLIKTPSLNILFDSGQTDELLSNAQKLGEDLSTVNAMIISHGHYDHTGGLESFLKINTTAKVYIKRSALESKYSSSTGEIRPIGIPFDITPYYHRFVFVEDSYQLTPEIGLLGIIKRTTSYETDNTKLLKMQNDSFVPDSFDDELVMYVCHASGLVIISGCAHRGMINTINSVSSHTKEERIRLFTGGTHLNGAPTHRLSATIEALKSMQINQLMPNHCTGIQTFQLMSKQLPFQVSYASTGTIVSI